MQIKELKIFSSKIKKQTNFYSSTLGLEIVRHNDDFVSFKVGNSLLHIEYKSKMTPYHFAINIPANKINEALDWVKSKVEILKHSTHEIQDFKSWNAKAIYFYDKDNNIVELIARKNLNNSINQKFDATLFLELSEIGLPTSNIKKEFDHLKNIIGLELYDGEFEKFCAIGDEHGLFICINKNKKKWFPTNDEAYSSDFELKLIEKKTAYLIKFKNEELLIES